MSMFAENVCLLLSYSWRWIEPTWEFLSLLSTVRAKSVGQAKFNPNG